MRIEANAAVLVALIVVAGGLLDAAPIYHNSETLRVPALVFGLRTVSTTESGGSARPPTPGGPAQRLSCCGTEAGLTWWMLPDRPSENPASWRLPPGVVLALRHSRLQGAESVRA